MLSEAATRTISAGEKEDIFGLTNRFILGNVLNRVNRNTFQSRWPNDCLKCRIERWITGSQDAEIDSTIVIRDGRRMMLLDALSPHVDESWIVWMVG
jgi:hypothetical protein